MKQQKRIIHSGFIECVYRETCQMVLDDYLSDVLVPGKVIEISEFRVALRRYASLSTFLFLFVSGTSSPISIFCFTRSLRQCQCTCRCCHEHRGPITTGYARTSMTGTCIAHFERVARLSDWDDVQMLANMYLSLEDTARSWFENKEIVFSS